MKSEERHRLKENDFQVMFQRGIDAVVTHSGKIFIGLAAVIVISVTLWVVNYTAVKKIWQPVRK